MPQTLFFGLFERKTVTERYQYRLSDFSIDRFMAVRR